MTQTILEVQLLVYNKYSYQQAIQILIITQNRSNNRVDGHNIAT